MKKITNYVCPYCSAEVGNHDNLKSHITTEHQREAISAAEEPEETFIKGMGLGGHGGIALHIDSKNGRIVRIRPLRYDEKYKPEEFNPWRIEARGKAYEPPMKTLPHPYVAAYKKRVYSPNRIKYPLKRVDWDPNGERNPQNRGNSKFKRITWDEATDIIASEIKRIQAKYGLYDILAQGDGHGEGKVVHAAHGCQYELLELIGGCTAQIRNPDSWEGYWWGAKHAWGNMFMGLMAPRTNLVKDMA